ncbi:MAG: hypothetical protein RBJ76_13335 [Stenomitos frigidus ULC029]
MLPLSVWLFEEPSDEDLTTLYSPDIPRVGDILWFSTDSEPLPGAWEVKKVRRDYSASGHFVKASIGVTPVQ